MTLGRFPPGCWKSPPIAAERRFVRRARRPMLAKAIRRGAIADPRAGLADPDDLAAELERALGELRPHYRLVFVLFHEQNLSYEEIARAVSRPIGTVKTWLIEPEGSTCRRPEPPRNGNERLEPMESTSDAATSNECGTS